MQRTNRLSAGRSLLWIAVLAGAPLGAIGACAPAAQTTWSDDQADRNALAGVVDKPHVDLCRAVRAGGMRCFAKAVAGADGLIAAAAAPSGYGPSDLRSAYKLPAGGGSGRIVAIVDAYDDPTAESDLATYRSTFGLPPCTTANGCFKKVDQNGGTSYPSPDSGWSGEISLDVDMVSAVCPDCKIVLVEASSATTQDLGTAVNTAASLGASAISNSYGGPEDSSVSTASSQYYNHPGILVTVSSGDSGFGVQFPASSQYVVAVGGTTLTPSGSSRGWAEGAWSSAGSGCSAFLPKPSWQKDTQCGKRMEADVSAVADPNTGVAVYFNGQWGQYGGTSASSPIIAAAYTLLNLAKNDPSYAYTHASSYYDVTSGSNGSCGGTYECTAGPGYDGPTGIGTPNGAALSGSGGSDAGATDSGGSKDSGGGTDAGKESGSPEAGSEAGTDSGSDGGTDGGSSCKHAICATGSKLTSTCDPCASQICAQDPYCCNNRWDNVCVSEVGSICGQSCGGTGCHPICNAGSKLGASCDPCAAQVCAQDPYCCSTLWDNQCVGEVGSICGQTCP
jgi:hypothetical protein